MVDEDRPESMYTDEMKQNKTQIQIIMRLFKFTTFVLYIFKFQIKISYNVGR